MRVPSIGLPLDERRIVREGYRIAEAMMANYREPPGLMETALAIVRRASRTLAGLLQSLVRG